MYKVTFNKEPDERFWMQKKAADEQFDPHSFLYTPTATAWEVFRPTSPKILKRKRETVTTNQKIQIRVQTQTSQIIRITCEVCTLYLLMISYMF